MQYGELARAGAAGKARPANQWPRGPVNRSRIEAVMIRSALNLSSLGPTLRCPGLVVNSDVNHDPAAGLRWLSTQCRAADRDVSLYRSS